MYTTLELRTKTCHTSITGGFEKYKFKMVAGLNSVSILAGAADPCSSNPCQNGATCINEGDSVTCKCTDGYFGRYCENGGRRKTSILVQ